MKIVQIVTQMEAGGAQRVAYLLHQQLVDRGHDAELWFLYRKRGAYDQLPGVRSLCLQPPGPLGCCGIVVSLYSLLKSRRPDAVITHSHYANVIGNVVAQWCGIRRRIAVHHSPVETYPPAARIADRVIAEAGTYTSCVAVSDTVMQSFSNHSLRYRGRLVRVYNGLALPGGENHVRDWASLGVPAGQPLIFNAGRLSKVKNQRALIDSLVDLPGFHLAIAGEGELSSELRARARYFAVEDRVHFLGEIRHEEVLALMGSCDVFASCSLYEAMGLAVLEAMLVGAPVVASDIAAHRELLGDAGILVAPHEFATAIQTITSRPALCQQLTERARRRAKKFNLDTMVRAYEHILHC